MSRRLCHIVGLLFGAIACGSHASEPKAGATDRTRHRVAPGDPCVPTPQLTILDEHQRPVDMSDDASVERVSGHPVLVCAPVRRALSGRVVDQETNGPLSNASVTVESWQTPAPIGGLQPIRRLRHSVTVQTDSQGRWAVPEQSDWMPGILAADGLPFFIDSWCIRAKGYASQVYDPWLSKRDDRSPANVALRRGNVAEPRTDSKHSACGLLISPDTD
jgi:hypothetical protein